ncbi:MAG: hypothetical protein DRO40_07705 [Thermoprotei archaeon]|nr:MAG: hypothetical protein DRO40_07705 [Thermoprotei archaeon]
MFQGISIAFSSPLVALYLIMVLSTTIGFNLIEFTVLMIFLFILPLFIPLYYSAKKGIEWDYPVRRERIKPMSLVTLNYIVGLIVMVLANAREHVRLLMFTYMVIALAVTIITFFYKISIHVASISGPATYLALIGLTEYSILFYILSLIVGISRIYLKRHTIGQIISGYIASIIIALIAYLVYSHIAIL